MIPGTWDGGPGSRPQGRSWLRQTDMTGAWRLCIRRAVTESRTVVEGMAGAGAQAGLMHKTAGVAATGQCSVFN